MGAFRYTPPGESVKRPRTEQSQPRVPTPIRQPDVAPRQRNVEPALSLGDTRYFSYRDDVYRVPPIPFKVGQRVLDSHILAQAHSKQVASTGDKKLTEAYYAELSILAKLLWRHVQPLGKLSRLCWHLGLLRNPFAAASEMEIRDVADFFLQGRMISHVRHMSETEVATRV